LTRIQGYLETNEQKAKLIELLKKNHLVFPLEIWTNEQLVDLAKDAVRTAGYDVSVESADLGVITLKGVVKDQERLNRLTSALKNDVPGIAQIRNDVLTLEEISTSMADLLRTSRLEGEIRFKTFPRYVLVEGELSEQDKPKWQEVGRTFKETYGRYLALRDNLIFRTEEAAKTAGAPRTGQSAQTARTSYRSPEAVGLTVEAVVMGKVKYFVNANGRKLCEGETFQDGFTIQKVERWQVTLIRGGEKIVVPLERVPIFFEYNW
jgi:type III secretion system YscD/HrpQ family protein